MDSSILLLIVEQAQGLFNFDGRTADTSAESRQ